ncbi:MAG: CoA transferase [Dehalococcoidia bacterium]|nr:CoA transferase [Dehalococcoidia bacterium]
MSEAPLSGLTILDLSQYIAGPYCTKLLAGLGAEVIKIEKPGRGDGSRSVGPFYEDDPHPDKSALFLYLNTNKKSITLNLKSSTGVGLFKDLVKQADIVIESFAPRVMPSLGLDYETLKQINPDLLMSSISNFGQTGPYKDYLLTEMLGLAIGGLMSITGDPEREPLKLGAKLAQYITGLHAYMATMVAIHCRDNTGIGQQVDVSVMESVSSILDVTPMWASYNNMVRPRAGNRHTGTYPFCILFCRDGYTGIIAASPKHWELFCKSILKKPELIADPRFATSHARLQNCDELDAEMLEWTMEHDKEEIYHLGQSMGLPFGYVATFADLIKSPQLLERKFFEEVDHPVVGKALYPGRPFKMSEAPWEPLLCAPLLGEHNEEVFGRLGLSREDMVRLREQNVI